MTPQAGSSERRRHPFKCLIVPSNRRKLAWGTAERTGSPVAVVRRLSGRPQGPRDHNLIPKPEVLKSESAAISSPAWPGQLRSNWPRGRLMQAAGDIFLGWTDGCRPGPEICLVDEQASLAG